MEKITQWRWDIMDETGSYWFDRSKNQMVIMKKPDGGEWAEVERRDAMDVMIGYTVIGYHKLQDHSQRVFDFLTGRGVRPTKSQVKEWVMARQL